MIAACALAASTLTSCALAVIPTVVAAGSGGGWAGAEQLPELPSDLDLAQFFPKQEDFPSGWAIEVKPADRAKAEELSVLFSSMGLDPQELTEPKGCFPLDLFSAMFRDSSLQARSDGAASVGNRRYADHSSSQAPGLTVEITRPTSKQSGDLIAAMRDRLERCSSFTLKSPESLSSSDSQTSTLKPVDLPKARVSEAVAFLMTSQKSGSPNQNAEIVITKLRGVLLVITPPLDDGSSATPELYTSVYTKTVERINSWRA